MRDALVAAADVVNGAMVALVPSDDDAKRLVVEGGEPLDQLHLTLLYLGEADQIGDDIRAALIDAGRDMALGWNGVAAEAFAPALFNPAGDEPCAVMLCSGAELAEFYETAIADLTELIDLPEDLHVPWCAHITLFYLAPTTEKPQGTVDLIMSAGDNSPLMQAMWATGPVTFDRLRFAFGGEVTDIPLIQTPRAPADSLQQEPAEATTARTPTASPGSESEPAVVAAAHVLDDGDRAEFDGCLRCHGPAHTGDCPPAL